MDARKRRSRLAIERAFSELLLEQDYAKITVADVLARSGVGRATFYAQFKGKDDLLAELVSGLCTCALRVGDGCDLAPEEQLEQILQNLWDRREGVRALVKGAGSRQFADCLRHAIVSRAAREVPEEPTGPAGQMNRSFLLHHIAATFVGMVQWWAWSDFASTPQELSEDFLRATKPLFE